jgi:tetratricopeptide (TPR) repeat protein
MPLQREQVVQTAEKYVSRGKIEPAIREYRKLLAENPNDINTLNRIGDLYARIQRIDEAVEFFVQIGEQYSDQGFFVKAIAIYKKIIKLDPTRLEIYEKLADLYHKQNLVTEARTQYQVLADYYTKHDNMASAIAIYNKMVDLEPENPSYHVKLAEIYQNGKLYEKAVNEYRMIAELMIQHGRTQEAAQVYERALTIDSKNLRFIRGAVEALRDAGAEGAAAHFLANAIERNPEAQEIAEELRRPRQVTVELEPEARPEMPAQAAAAPTPAAAPPQETDEEEPSFEVELDVEEDLMAAMKAAEAAVAAKGEEVEFDLDLDEMEVDLSAEEEEAPASQVRPPADLGAGHRPGWALQAQPLEIEEISFDLDAIAAAEPEAETYAEAEAFVLDTDIEPGSDTLEMSILPAWEAEETAAPSVDERDELITEAEVLAKYGLDEKALERLEEALRAKPENLAAYALMVRLHLDKHRHEQVFELAQRMSAIAVRNRRGEPWTSVRARLAEEGYLLDGDDVVAGPHMSWPPAAVPDIPEVETAPEPEIDLDLELPQFDLPEPEPEPSVPEVAPPPPPPPAAPRSAAQKRETEELLRGILGGKPRPAPPKPAAPAPAPMAPPPAPVAAAAPPPAPPPPAPAQGLATGGLFDLTSLGSMIEEEERTGTPAAIPPPPPQSLPFTGGLEDSGVGWLDEAESRKEPAVAAGSAAPAGGGLFDDEDDFFDLAGELVEELSKEEVFQDGLVQQEQSLEEIVEGFKKGVAEHLSPTDYDTHYNLGIAYREMGLLDEAIGEFQLAAKDARHLVICCSMLGLCFLDKGLPELSIKWYRRGMEAPGLAEEDQLGLMYDLGNAYMAMGDNMSAYGTFVELYGINTNYRDVVAKLEELRK